MKLDCGPTKAEREVAREIKRVLKETARREWHKVFVIWPRRVGSHDCRAFETVERRWTKIGETYGHFPLCGGPFDVFGWEYRACQ
jgi:hypothetical protein